jgi:hypothetical protein
VFFGALIVAEPYVTGSGVEHPFGVIELEMMLGQCSFGVFVVAET